MLENRFDNLEDNRLAESIKQGNKQSLGLLYDKFAPALFGVITKIAGNEQLAEEILRATFVHAFRSIAMWDPSKISIFTWLNNIARQRAFEEIKSHKIKSNGSAGIVSTQIDNKTDKSLKHLKANQKAALNLIYYKGLTYTEAAAELKIAVDKLKSDLRMAIKNLKSMQVT